MNETSDYERVTKSFMQTICLKHWFIIKKWPWVSHWIIYSTNLFKTLINSYTKQVLISDSLDHSLNIFIKKTLIHSWMKKDNMRETLNH